jgi:hypothetical protein
MSKSFREYLDNLNEGDAPDHIGWNTSQRFGNPNERKAKTQKAKDINYLIHNTPTKKIRPVNDFMGEVKQEPVTCPKCGHKFKLKEVKGGKIF